MKRLGISIISCVLLLALAGAARGQILKPIDTRQSAEVGQKNVNFGDVPLQLLKQPNRPLADSPLSKGNLQFQGVETQNLELQSLELNGVSTETLPQPAVKNERAPGTDSISDVTHKKVTDKSAPINDRQIRAFTPGGEEELKKQLNEPR